MKRALSFFSLFTSSATLICCALPVLFVSLGAGAALAGLIGAVPGVVWFSENKSIVFGVGAITLAGAGLLRWRAKTNECPIDPAQREVCQQSKDYSGWIYGFSVGVYLIGTFFAFIAPLVFD